MTNETVLNNRYRLVAQQGSGGMAVIYKGASAPQEVNEARKAIDLLGGEMIRMEQTKVPLLEEQRFVLLIKKQRPTPERFPRSQGLPRKKPLG